MYLQIIEFLYFKIYIQQVFSGVLLLPLFWAFIRNSILILFNLWEITKIKFDGHSLVLIYSVSSYYFYKRTINSYNNQCKHWNFNNITLKIITINAFK